MTLVPVGKLRLMKVQSITDPVSGWFPPGQAPAVQNQSIGQMGLAETKPMDDGSNINLVNNNTPNLDGVDDYLMDKTNIPEEAKKPQMQSGGGIKDFVFEKLQGFGYPPRRLLDFKDKFAKMSIDSDFSRTVEIDIPDKHYGNNKPIDKEEFAKFVKEIEQKFDLYFEKADNNDGRWTIAFTSVNMAAQNAVEEEISGDNLEQIYGTPSGTQKDKTNVPQKQASSIQELMQSRKDELVNTLNKILNGED